ncbi:MAG: hypothetical protein V4592_16340 [Bacteroidota bacterium]
MTVKIKKQSIVKYIILTWLLCGTIDALSAIIINPQVPVAAIFRYIASGFFGKSAAAGGTEMVVYGVLFHYFIALVFTTLLFLLYPTFIKIFRNKVVLALVWGLMIFVIMNFLVVPYLSHIVQHPMKTAGVLKNMAALIVAFGFPIAYIAGKFYEG